MLTVERLRALSAVATYGSIARAAEALHVTPSGVSQQIGKLERETGHGLLERHGRSVRLTHAGKVLAGHAERVLADLERAEGDLAALHDEILGPLRLGGVDSAIRALLGTALDELVGRHPRLSPTVRDGEAIDLVPSLLAGDLDVALVESWSNRPMFVPEGLARTPLITEPVWLAVSEQHRLADRDVVDLSELDGATWATCGPGTEPYEALVQALRAQGIEPDIRYTVAEYPTQLVLVRANLAAALVPSIGADLSPPDVRLVATEPSLRREIHAAWRSTTDSPAIRACIAALQSASTRLDASGR